MATTSFEAEINPLMLKYAIETSGYSVDEVAQKISAKKAKFTKDHLLSVLNGSSKVLYSDLKKLDVLLKRGIAFFFLSQPPNESALLNFRKHNKDKKIEPKTETCIREYVNLRKDIKVLLDSLHVSYDVKKFNFSITKNTPSEVSFFFRSKWAYDKLNVAESETSDVFNFIRDKIEEEGVFVFKDSFEKNVRGLTSFSDNLPPLVLINSRDDKNAEIFSLLHEFAHYVLGNEELDLEKSYSENTVEKWCNDFAFSFLVTEADEKNEHFTPDKKALLISSAHLKLLSGKYKVSKRSLLVRFRIKNIISEPEYKSLTGEYVAELKKKKDAMKGGGNYYATLGTRLSKRFTNLVYDNYKNNNISATECFDYVGVHSSERLGELIGRMNYD